MTEYVFRWTQAAKECYDRGCICGGCYYSEQMETRCQMKKAVMELVRKFGIPPAQVISGNNGNTYYPKGN